MSRVGIRSCAARCDELPLAPIDALWMIEKRVVIPKSILLSTRLQSRDFVIASRLNRRQQHDRDADQQHHGDSQVDPERAVLSRSGNLADGRRLSECGGGDPGRQVGRRVAADEFGEREVDEPIGKVVGVVRVVVLVGGVHGYRFGVAADAKGLIRF